MLQHPRRPSRPPRTLDARPAVLLRNSPNTGRPVPLLILRSLSPMAARDPHAFALLIMFSIGFHTDAFNSSYWSFDQCLDWAHRQRLHYIECGAIDGVSWIHGLGYQP